MGALSAAGVSAADKAQPDVILIITDQQTASAMSSAGCPYVKTPAMDALAADGVSFTRAYCPFPLSNPSRASLMTGLMPLQTGVGGNNEGIRPEVASRNIGFTMGAAGYECLYAGKWHIPEIDIPDGCGFTRVCGMDDRSLAARCAPALEKRYDKPLFLVASLLDPHEICEWARDESLPYGPLAPFATEDAPNLPANFRPSTYEAEAIRLYAASSPRSHPTALYTEDDWRRYLYAYYRLVERVDEQVGRLVELLKKTGRYDNSLIIFTSDHGDGVAAHGWNQKWVPFEEVINVPLIVKAPGGQRGVRNTQAISNIGLDIFATVCDYGGARPAGKYDGRSYRSVVEGRGAALHDDILVETSLETLPMRAWAVVGERYKYVLYRYFRNREALYDLQNDPGEMRNLAVDKAYAAQLDDMRARMMAWAERVGDLPLKKSLNGLNAK